MANYVVTDQSLTSVANAIRTKGGTSDIMHWPNEFVSAIQNIPTGGGGGSTDGDVVFIDYDGSVVTAKTKAEINAMTSDSDLPANPSHTGLNAQGWNWTVAQLKAQLLAMPTQKVYVGQMYITTSGATEIDIELVDDLALTPYLYLAINGSVTIDWGDNSATDTVTGTSTTSRKYKQHVYQTTGNYTISITVNSGKFRFYVDASYPILTDKNSSSQYASRKYSSSIKRIRLGENVDGNSTFRDHYSLNSITIPSGVTSIGENAFYDCYSLASITIPSGVTSIGNSSFRDCRYITSVTIPSGVTSIGSSAFNGCYSLTSITIPSGVTSIGSSAFSGCCSITNISIPSSVTSIWSSAFSGWHSLTSITIPSEVTSIGSSAFYQCYSITNISIPSSVTSIGNSAFRCCYSLTSITIPSRVTSIEAYAFYQCYSLTSITIPSGVTSIGDNAFYYCYSLTSITIPSGVTSIGSSAFYQCYSLTNITIPSSVTSIGNSAFLNCYSLTSITIPSEVTSIGNSAFSSCYSVLAYHFERTTPPTLGTTAFNSIQYGCKIYVPYSADHSILNAYKGATNWSTYASYMQEEPAP